MGIDSMKWILDDMVFNDITCAVPATDFASWPDIGLMLADATAQAADHDSSGRRQAFLAARSRAGADPIIRPFSVTQGSEAWGILYNHLRPGFGGTADLAEHESIAWALTHSGEDPVLVTRDKHAAMLALAELGRGRVCHPCELFEHLHSQGCLTRQQLDDLMNSTHKQDRSIPIPWRLSRERR